MTLMSPEPQHARNRWTIWQGIVVFLLSVATLGTAGPAVYSVYQTSCAFARPYLGQHEAWILPVALEAVFMVLFGWGIVLAWRKAADVPVRVAGSLAIAVLSFAVQIDAGNGSFSAILVRVAIVASFFVAGFTMKAAFMRLRGGKVRGDRVSLGEWLASPARAGLWRWKNAWAEPSAEKARQRYLVLLYVIALAQSDPRVGRRPFRWRRRLPVTLRYQLSTGLLPDAIAAGQEGWQEAADVHVAGQLALLERATPDATEDDTAVRQDDASETDSADATPDATEAPARQPESRQRTRQRTRQPTAAERAKATARVRRLLDANPDWTLAEVAAKAKVSERTVSRVKNAPPERPSLRVAGTS